MIIGNGLLANAFKNVETDCIIFASGPSDSKNATELEFRRENDLLAETIANNRDKMIVYFSTSSILDPSLEDSSYCIHKREMEDFIKKNAGKYLIARISNVVGRTGNPKTIFNYFKNHILSGEKFELWSMAERNLIDVDDLVRILIGLINEKWSNETVLVVNPISIPVLQLVGLLEVNLRKKGNYTLKAHGNKLNFYAEIATTDLIRFGANFGADYYRLLIDKYV